MDNKQIGLLLVIKVGYLSSLETGQTIISLLDSGISPLRQISSIRLKISSLYGIEMILAILVSIVYHLNVDPLIKPKDTSISELLILGTI